MRRLDQRGAVSLLSATIFSIIVTVIVTLYARTAVIQQREAVDYDLGNRAIYSAQSGVQDAIRGINNNSTLMANGQNTCLPLVDEDGSSDGRLGNPGVDYGLNYTCQIINTSPTRLEGEVGINKNVLLEIKPASPTGSNFGVQIFSVENTADDSAIPVTAPRATGGKYFTNTSSWVTGSPQVPIHPVLRTSFITHALNSVSRSGLRQRVYYHNPTTQTGATGVRTVNFSAPESTAAAESVTNASCYPSGDAVNSYDGYACRQSYYLGAFNFGANSLYLRLGSIYGASKFKVVLTTGATTSNPSDGTPVPLTSAQALIDVTGKSGRVYRRIIQAVPLAGGYREDNLPEAALVAGEGICKNVTLGLNNNQFVQNCNPTTPPYF